MNRVVMKWEAYMEMLSLEMRLHTQHYRHFFKGDQYPKREGNIMSVISRGIIVCSDAK
jgi:hypothetical protein